MTLMAVAIKPEYSAGSFLCSFYRITELNKNYLPAFE